MKPHLSSAFYMSVWVIRYSAFDKTVWIIVQLLISTQLLISVHGLLRKSRRNPLSDVCSFVQSR